MGATKRLHSLKRQESQKRIYAVPVICFVHACIPHSPANKTYLQQPQTSAAIHTSIDALSSGRNKMQDTNRRPAFACEPNKACSTLRWEHSFALLYRVHGAGLNSLSLSLACSAAHYNTRIHVSRINKHRELLEHGHAHNRAENGGPCSSAQQTAAYTRTSNNSPSIEHSHD